MRYGLTIPMFSHRGGEFVHLRVLLDILGSEGERSIWQVENVEALGSGADELHLASDSGRTFFGAELKRLVSKLEQIVDGEFIAFKSNESQPWIVIKAGDSTFYDVMTDELEVLSMFRKVFASSQFIAGMEPPAIM